MTAARHGETFSVPVFQAQSSSGVLATFSQPRSLRFTVMAGMLHTSYLFPARGSVGPGCGLPRSAGPAPAVPQSPSRPWRRSPHRSTASRGHSGHTVAGDQHCNLPAISQVMVGWLVGEVGLGRVGTARWFTVHSFMEVTVSLPG